MQQARSKRDDASISTSRFAVFHAYGWDDLRQKLNVGPASRRSINAPGNDRRDAGLTLDSASGDDRRDAGLTLAAGASLREEVEAELLERLVAVNHATPERAFRGGRNVDTDARAARPYHWERASVLKRNAHSER